MNPIIESNKEFAERLLEKLAPRVTDGTGIQGTLNAGDTGALYHIAQAYLISLQCQWISVGDRLPDLGVFVLVCGKKHQVVFTATLEHSQSPYFENNEEGYFWEGRNLTSLALADISHWMPLPQPPKEQP